MADLDISEHEGLGLGTIMARNHIDASAIGAALGLELADGPVLTCNDELSLAGTGPGIWLAMCHGAQADWAERLAEKLDGIASVSDQSGGYAIFQFSGTDARELLQRGAFIDLHSSAFGPQSVATTAIAHIGAILWQRDETSTFEVAVFRSFAASFRDWIAAAREGLGEARPS